MGLRDNQPSSLPESVGGSARLRSLGLDSSQLISLPESFEEPTMLQSLGLGSNQLRGARSLEEFLDDCLADAARALP